jgi:uncharacterized protein YdhG (YjbR/CyaY superfamily)
MSAKPQTIDEYIGGFPIATQKILEEVRTIIKKAAPEATEMISYAILAFKLNGKGLIHYAGYKNHIGLYPTPKGDETFREEIAPYKSGKSTIQFPLDKRMPSALITKIIKFRIAENSEKTKKK